MIRITESPVIFSNEGMQLVGMLHRPEHPPKPPAVVFFHGCTTTRNEAHWLFIKIARALARMGILAFRFDFRHNGESEGDFSLMTLSGEVSDGIRAIETVVEKHGADPERLGIIAMSMGGAIGAVVAGRLRDRIASCVLLNPVGHPFEDLRAIAARSAVDLGSFPIVYRTFTFGEPFVHDLPAIRPFAEIRNATCPVLVISGTGDTTIDPARSRQYVDVVRSAGGRAELLEMHGADHLFSSIHWEQEIIGRVTRWFGESLNGHGSEQ
jgi:pimeloyl-ACP methyl ester carboxylesterase